MEEYKSNQYAPANQMGSAPTEPHFKKSFCKYCGTELNAGMAFCPSCGKPQRNVPVQQPINPIAPQSQQFYGQPIQQQPAYAAGFSQQSQPSHAMSANTANNSTQNTSTTVVVQGGSSNGLGTAGFVFALLAFFVCWIPFVDFIVWFLGALFSFIGLFKKPRGLAIAGFILSFIGIAILLTFFGALLGFANLSGR